MKIHGSSWRPAHVAVEAVVLTPNTYHDSTDRGSKIPFLACRKRDKNTRGLGTQLHTYLFRMTALSGAGARCRVPLGVSQQTKGLSGWGARQRSSGVPLPQTPMQSPWNSSWLPLPACPMPRQGSSAARPRSHLQINTFQINLGLFSPRQPGGILPASRKAHFL